MKKLSEFKGKQATDLLGYTLLAVGDIMQNEANKKALQEKGPVGLIGAALINTPDAIVSLVATLNEIPVDQYDYNAVTLGRDAFAIFKDPELIQLFNLQD